MSYIIEFKQPGLESIDEYLRIIRLVLNKTPTRNMLVSSKYAEQWNKPIIAITYHWSFAYIGEVSPAVSFEDRMNCCLMAGRPYTGASCEICPGFFKLDFKKVSYFTSAGVPITRIQFLSRNAAVEAYNHQQNCFGVSELSKRFGSHATLAICPIKKLPDIEKLCLILSVREL